MKEAVHTSSLQSQGRGGLILSEFLQSGAASFKKPLYGRLLI